MKNFLICMVLLFTGSAIASPFNTAPQDIEVLINPIQKITVTIPEVEISQLSTWSCYKNSHSKSKNDKYVCATKRAKDLNIEFDMGNESYIISQISPNPCKTHKPLDLNGKPAEWTDICRVSYLFSHKTIKSPFKSLINVYPGDRVSMSFSGKAMGGRLLSKY